MIEFDVLVWLSPTEIETLLTILEPHKDSSKVINKLYNKLLSEHKHLIDD